MRIATWNVERLKHKNKLDDICIERRGGMTFRKNWKEIFSGIIAER